MGKKTVLQRIEILLKKGKIEAAKTLGKVECTSFRNKKKGKLKKCKKCKDLLMSLCLEKEIPGKEVRKGVGKGGKGESKKGEKGKGKSEEVEKPEKETPVNTNRKSQPYDEVMEALLQGTANKDIVPLIVGKSNNPIKFIQKVSCVYNAIIEKSKSRGVIYKGVKELKAGKKISKSGSAGTIKAVWDSFNRFEVEE